LFFDKPLPYNGGGFLICPFCRATLNIALHQNMLAMIFLRAIRQIIDPPDPNIPRPEFDVEIYKANGQKVNGRVVCTSSNWANNTINLKFIESGQIRKFKACLMTRFNGKEVML
jgi:hypothetical protein